MFQYFKAMRTTKSHLRFFDFCGNVLDALGQDQDACAVAYADDGYIKAKLSVALEVLSDIKLVLQEDAGLGINAVV